MKSIGSGPKRFPTDVSPFHATYRALPVTAVESEPQEEDRQVTLDLEHDTTAQSDQKGGTMLLFP